MTMQVAARASGELSRTGIEVRLLSQAWQGRPSGDRFTRSLATFLGSKSNKGTQRVYGFAITEFFNWAKQAKGFYPLPNEVLREDAARFVRWLQDRSIGVDEMRLEQDEDRLLDLQIYRAVKAKPESDIKAIRKELLRDSRLVTVARYPERGIPREAIVLKIETDEPRGDELTQFIDRHGHPPDNALDIRLACLCQHNLLRRAPSVIEIREGIAEIGLPDASQAQIGYRVDPNIFRYWANEYTDARGGDRAGTIVTKLSALSSYWSFLVKSTGENVAGMDALLRTNIWREALAQIRPTALNRAQSRREESTPDRELFLKLLSATFAKSHRSQARQAAEAYLEGVDVRASELDDPSRYDLRDRAVLCFIYWTGVRAEELSSIRRSDLSRRTGVVSVTGKGDKRRSFRVPDPALKAIDELQRSIDSAKTGEPKTLLSLLTEEAAPLFPPLKLWGRAQRSYSDPEDIEGLSPSGLARMLHERAEQAGVDRGSDDWYRLHPHGLRHLAALEANRRGVDIATIQATLGHASLAHTGIYLEVRDPTQRSLQPQTAPLPPPPVVPVPAPMPTTKAPKKGRRGAIPEAPGPAVVQGPTDVSLVPVEHEGDIISYETPEELVELPEPETRTEAYLFDVYENRWGEKGEGARTHIAGQATGQLAKGLVSHAYAGLKSALPWWTGSTGNMDSKFSYKPNIDFSAMPILSQRQFEPDPSGAAEIADELARLFRSWTTPVEQGGEGVYPTAAAALLGWIRTADDVSEAASARLEERGGKWIAFEEPLVETGKPPMVLREHYVPAVAAWFQATAWQYRPMASGIPGGGPMNLPRWWNEEDPLQSMDADDREELLAWLQVLVGRLPTDKTPRFDGYSREDVARFMALMCGWENFRREETSGGRRRLSDDAVSQLKQIDLAICELLTGRKAILRPDDKARREKALSFCYATSRKERFFAIENELLEAEREAKRSEPVDGDDLDPDESGKPRVVLTEREKKAREAVARFLQSHFLSMVKEIFGKEASEDPILKVFALCSRHAPLERHLEFAGLFQVEGGTIKHDPVFKRIFARKHKAHSECLARRLARTIWEKGRLKKGESRGRWESDPLINALYKYRVPCTDAQEAELMALLGDEFDESEIYQQVDAAVSRAIYGREPTEVQIVQAEDIGWGSLIGSQTEVRGGETRALPPVRLPSDEPEDLEALTAPEGPALRAGEERTAVSGIIKRKKLKPNGRASDMPNPVTLLFAERMIRSGRRT